MIEQQGKVVAVVDGRACVRLGGTSGCASCDAGKGCGAGVFGRLLKRKPINLELDNPIKATAGQPVIVGIPGALFLRLITRLYFLPVLAGIAGAAFGHYLAVLTGLGQAGSDLITLLGGLAGGGAVVLWNRNGSREFPKTFIVHLLRIVEIQDSGT